MGGGGGYTQSSTNSAPWEEVQPLLKKMLDTVMAGAYNRQSTPGGGTDLATEHMLDMFTGKNSIGKLDYFGDWLKDDTSGWQDPKDLNYAYPYEGNSGDLKIGYAPTVAPFSNEQQIAQGIIEARLRKDPTYIYHAKNYETGYSPLITNSKIALDKILKGETKIDPASMNAATVENIDQIAQPRVVIPGSMQTPTIDSTDLGYKYWSELGDVTGNKKNPYLEQMIDTAKDNMRNEYLNYQIPSLDSTAERAGAYGGGRWGKVRNDAWNTYLKNIGQVESGMRGNAFETNMNRALQGMSLGGDLAKSQSGMDSERALQQALLEMNKRSTEYGTSAEAERLKSQLRLQADTTNVNNMLQRALENARFHQGANETNAGFTQQSRMGNVQNILQGVPYAGNVAQADYQDVANLAAVGEEKANKWQDIIDEYKKRMETKQMEPWNRAGMVSNLSAGNWGGTTTSRGKSGK